MQDHDKTTLFTGGINQIGRTLITIFDSKSESRTIRLNKFCKYI